MMKRALSLFIIFAVMLSSFALDASAFSAEGGGIVSVRTPVSAETSALKWTKKFGNSYLNAPSTQIIAEDTMIVMCRKKLYKLDLKTGEVLQSADMLDTPSYSYTPPAYANGMVFVPLDNGIIQAFDFETLTPLWVYTDVLGGQSLTPIAYDNGCIYTGFWNDEDENASFVCIDVKDENKNLQTEAKKAKWTYTQKGGFYWAGAAVYGNYVLVGTDDGTIYDNKPSKVLSLNKTTGKMTDSCETIGDIRSSVQYDKESNRFYFVSKAGYLYSVKLNLNGTFDDASLMTLKLGGASTSTPVIYNGRVYIGVQSKGFGKGYMYVVEAQKLSLIYTAEIKGYPQNEVLLSNAYEKKDGNIYIYTTYNANPGGITVLTDSQGQTQAKTQELFIPQGDMAGYCISSIVSDEAGSLYYKNDSGTIFAIENTLPEEKPSVLETIWTYIKAPFLFLYHCIKTVITWIGGLF